MAGIKANSAEKSMGNGDTAVDQDVTGYTLQSQIVLTTYPTGTNYQWAIALPSGSSSGYATLSDTNAAAPVFTPDSAGEYTIVVDVDGTDYKLGITVADFAVVEWAQIIRLGAVPDASVPSPGQGQILVFCGEDHSNAPCVKVYGDTIYTIDLTAV